MVHTTNPFMTESCDQYMKSLFRYVSALFVLSKTDSWFSRPLCVSRTAVKVIADFMAPQSAMGIFLANSSFQILIIISGGSRLGRGHKPLVLLGGTL